MDLDELYHIMRRAHVQAQGVMDTFRDPLLVLDSEFRVQAANPAFYRTFAVDRDETVGRLVHELGRGQWDIGELRHLLEEVIPKSASVVDFEVSAEFPDIGPRTMLVSAQRLSHPDSHSRVLLLTIVDATERRRREGEKELVIGELRHRIKNLLALTQALARQTVAKGRSGEEYRDAFLGRFASLIASLDISETGQPTDLSELARRTLEPYASDSAAIKLETNSHVSLKATQTLAVGMILHELATNAIKHGALSAPGGQLQIGWGVEADREGTRRVHLRWRETDGPKVSPPARRGFGTRLIEFAAARDLGGDVELDYAPEGLLARVRFPL